MNSDDRLWELIILHTNDSHGHLMPIYTSTEDFSAQYKWCHSKRKERWLGGFFYLAEKIKQIRRTNRNVLLLDAGDAWGDTLISQLTNGKLNLQAMNYLKYDAMTPGNHDIDFGIDRLKQIVNEANFPFLAANLLDVSSRDYLLGTPYLIKRINGVNIGIYGLTYHLTPETTAKDNITGAKYELDFNKINRDIKGLKNKGVDIVVVLSHLGNQVDKKLAREVEDIDVIVGGHSHDPVELEKVNGTILSQATPYYTGLGYLRLRLNGSEIIGSEGKIIPIYPEQITFDEKIEEMIRIEYVRYRPQLQEIVGYSFNPIIRNYKDESPADTLFGNILREVTNSHISILPGRGFGITIPKGYITMEWLANLLPHNSPVYTFYLKGVDLVGALKQSIFNQINPDVTERVGGLIQVTGVSFVYSYTDEDNVFVDKVMVGGVPIEGERYYSIVANQLMAEGGHKYESLKNGINVKKHNFTVREIIKKWMQNHSPVIARKEGWSKPKYIEDKIESRKKCLPFE